MAASISQQLDDLLNPLPKFIDPEDDPDEDTKAKVIGQFDEGDDDDDDDDPDELSHSQLRKRSLVSLEESDWRYRGKPMSRKDLRKEIDGSADEDGEEDEVGMSEKESLEEECDGSDIADDGEEDEEDESNQSQMSRLVSKIKDTNFLKLSEEMEGLEEEDDEEASDEEEVDSENISGEEEEHLDSALRTFSKEKVDEEVEKGKAVKNQLGLWDLLLERRIKLQKAVVTANQLPQPQTFADFKRRGGEDYAESLKNSHKALKALQRSLLELQDLLLFQNPETRPISQGHAWGDQSIIEDDEEILSDDDMGDEDGERNRQEANQNKPWKRKMAAGEYPDFMAKRYADFLPYRDSTLQKWYDKTQLTSGKNSKGFGAFDRNILTQVSEVLTDKERLVRRTQTRRSDLRVLGKADADITDGEAADSTARGNAHLNTQDPEIFDDDDFYHQLLRELIERRTSATDPNDQVAMGRQWLAIQKLRRKIKKKVDTKASKGRKIRFHVHSKLVNFMAPMDPSSMSDEARSELFRSLFADASVTQQQRKPQPN